MWRDGNEPAFGFNGLWECNGNGNALTDADADSVGWNTTANEPTDGRPMNLPMGDMDMLLYVCARLQEDVYCSHFSQICLAA